MPDIDNKKIMIIKSNHHNSTIQQPSLNPRVSLCKDDSLVPETFRDLPTPRYPKRFSFVNHGMRFLWREVRASLKLSFILFCFVVLWTPFIAINIEHYRCTVDIGYPCNTITLDMVKYFKLLHYSNSALNPLLYLMLNKSWKIAFKLTLCCGDRMRHRLALKSVIGW